MRLKVTDENGVDLTAEQVAILLGDGSTLGGTNRAAHTTQDPMAPTETRYAMVADNDTVLVPGSVITITGSSLLNVDDIPTNIRKIICKSKSCHDATGINTILGWLVAVNAGTSTLAAQRMEDAIDSAQGVMRYGVNITPNGNVGVFFIAADDDAMIELDEDVVDCYLAPIGMQSPAAGAAHMMIGLKEAA